MAPKSLIHASRERYLSTIRSVQPTSRWKIIVVDAYTRVHLNSLLKLDAILRESVTVVEVIESQRAPQPGFEAAYLLCPTSENVERIIRDLTPDREGKTQYAAAHVFFVDALSDALLQRITSSRAEPRLRQLIELYNNFWPTESQAFSLKTPQSFFTLFQPPGGAWGLDAQEAMQAIEDELQFTVQNLLNVCVTLNEFPLIRYYNPSHPPLGPLTPAPGTSAATAPAVGAAAGLYAGSMRMARLRGAEAGNGASGGVPGSSSSSSGAGGEHFTRKLALRLQAAIDVYVRDNAPKADVGRPRGVLFITDRTMDTVAPFLHEFSYQAMINDLLPLEEEGTRYHYKYVNSDGEREDKTATLSDDDAVWRAIRHLHIAEAIERLTRDFAEHAGSAGQFAGASSLHDMRDMLASLPEMQETKEALSLHLTMAQECMNVFEKTRLPQQAMVEQNCATRTTPEGQKPRTLVEDMVPLLDDRAISNADKVRIIALYIMYSEGVPDEDRRRLFQHAKLGLHEMDAVDNLVHLGARVVKDPQNSGWDAWFSKGKRRQAPGENEYELSRYQPLVKLMLEDHFAGKLDQTTYPYVRDAPPDTTASLGAGLSLRDSAMAIGRANSPASATAARGGAAPSSLRSAKPTWHQKGRPGAAGAAQGSERNENRQRVIVFVAGGATYSEVRSAYQCSEKLGRDVYIGSSHIITPEGFIDSLKRFGKASGAAGAGAGAGQRQAHHHASSHSAHLPSGASHFSKPDNDKSGIRAQAARARDGGRHDYGDQSHAQGAHHDPHAHGHGHAHGQGHHGNGAAANAQTYQPDQSSYDRRFRSSAPIDQQQQQQNYGAPQQQQQQRPQGAPRQGGPQSYGPSSSAQMLHGAGTAADGRQSPAPSAMSAQSDGRVAKEKKKMKNPFSFKKS